MQCERSGHLYIWLIILLVFLATSGCAPLAPRVPSDYLVKEADMPFVFVKGGSFQMGSPNNPDEQPVHEVTIDDLYVGVFEVTFAQYEQFCAAAQECDTPPDEGWGRNHRPVINVTWHDANAYTQWLSDHTGHKFRLPSEAEWEYFARAGTTTPYWTGKTLPPGSANCRGCGSQWDNQKTAPVGSFRPNPWGIYDTAGNINEWTLDDFKRGYNGAPANGASQSIIGENRKVVRGGSWNYPPSALRSAARDYHHDDRKDTNIGFRVVLVPDIKTPQPAVKTSKALYN